MVCPVSTPESQLDRLSDASYSRYKQHKSFINKLQSSKLRYNNKDIIKMYIVIIIIINANHHDNEKGLAQSLI